MILRGNAQDIWHNKRGCSLLDINAHHRTIQGIIHSPNSCLSFCEMHLPKNSISTLTLQDRQFTENQTLQALGPMTSPVPIDRLVNAGRVCRRCLDPNVVVALQRYFDEISVIVPAEPLLTMTSSLSRAIMSAKITPRPTTLPDVPAGTASRDKRGPPPA